MELPPDPFDKAPNGLDEALASFADEEREAARLLVPELERARLEVGAMLGQGTFLNAWRAMSALECDEFRLRAIALLMTVEYNRVRLDGAAFAAWLNASP
jgi:hypothetical protein